MRVKNLSKWPLAYAKEGDIGLDLRANIETERTIEPGRRWKFDTGIAIELPVGHGALVQPRSGLSIHHGIYAATGVIDHGYRGPIAVVLYNFGHDPYKVLPGDRIAQLVIFPVAHVSVEEVDELTATERGASGFGSSGR